MQYLTYWLTRDGDPETGEPLPYVDIWYSRPTSIEVGDRGRIWLDRYGLLGERYGRWTVAQCMLECRVAPDAANQVIRVGSEHETRDVICPIVATA